MKYYFKSGFSKVAFKKTNLELKLMNRDAEKVSIGSGNDSHSSDI